MLALPRWRIIVCAVAVLFGLLFTLPNVLPANVSVPGLPSQRLSLGLDLQGGSYLLLEVDQASLKAERLNNLVEDVRSTLREQQIVFSSLGAVNGAVSLRITDEAQMDAARTALSKLGTLLQTGARDVTSRSCFPCPPRP